jgi:hypothetical protein
MSSPATLVKKRLRGKIASPLDEGLLCLNMGNVSTEWYVSLNGLRSKRLRSRGKLMLTLDDSGRPLCLDNMTMMVILEHKKSNGVILGLLWATND